MKTRLLPALLAALIGFLLAASLRAEESNVDSQVAEKHDRGLSITIGGDEKPAFKKSWEKLTPDQIFELEKLRAQQPEIPSQAPLIVAIVFACPVAIVAVILVYRYRRNLILHKTLASMIEKGVPIPPELLQPEKPPRNDLKRGFVLIGVGLGLIVFFAVQREEVWGLGFIPLLMGVGYLLAWKLARKNGNG
jgi:hypothetical protein